MKKILIIGAGEAGRMVAAEIAADPDLGLQLVGWLDDDPALRGEKVAGSPVLGTSADLERVVEAADVEEIDTQYLYRQGDTYVFMDSSSYEQYELSADQVDDAWKYLKEGMPCSMLLYNGNPITMTPPNHVELAVTECEPGAKGDTATNVTKPVKVETGAEFICPAFIKEGNVIKIDTRTGEYVERVSN